jgi:hypothetical protein
VILLSVKITLGVITFYDKRDTMDIGAEASKNQFIGGVLLCQNQT